MECTCRSSYRGTVISICRFIIVSFSVFLPLPFQLLELCLRFQILLILTFLEGHRDDAEQKVEQEVGAKEHDTEKVEHRPGPVGMQHLHR